MVNSLLENVIEKEITNIEVLRHKILIPLKKMGRQDPVKFTETLHQAKIVCIERKGKYLVFHCKRGDTPVYMISHLGMTGAFLAVQALDELLSKHQKHTHVRFQLNDGTILVYSDQRRFGWVGVLTEEEYRRYEPIQKLGPDPLTCEEADWFIANVRRNNAMNQPIKRLIMKPDMIAGVGNIYACESLFRARMHPLTPPKEMTEERLVELYGCIQKTLKDALESGGSSISDYVDSFGKKGSFQEQHQVYQKKNCPCCGGMLDNLRIDQRSSFYCPVCQAKEATVICHNHL